MKSYKKSKKVIYILMVFIIAVACFMPNVFAAEGTPAPSITPKIEMKVKSVTVNGSSQIKIECWGTNFSNVQSLDMCFTYDSEKLTPSKVNSNEVIEGLDEIKYSNWPSQNDKQSEFLGKSKTTLSQAFQFNSEYEDTLDIDIFRFLASDSNNETLQFVMSNKRSQKIIDAPILLGTFSFRKTEGATISEGDFTSKVTDIWCDGDYTNGETEFIYEKYGSISGEISATLPKTNGDKRESKNIATIKIYSKESVNEMEWEKTGTTYTNARKTLPAAMYEYTTTAEDNGIFKIENIEFGEYVILIDKNNYADYIITDIVVDSQNKDINLKTIELSVGDVNKDGKLNPLDKNNFAKAYKAKPKDVSFDLDDSGRLDPLDKSGMDVTYKNMSGKTIKKVVTLAEQNAEEVL